jgi:hypothetical protein
MRTSLSFNVVDILYEYSIGGLNWIPRTVRLRAILAGIICLPVVRPRRSAFERSTDFVPSQRRATRCE